jgi:hypothetical protein
LTTQFVVAAENETVSSAVGAVRPREKTRSATVTYEQPLNARNWKPGAVSEKPPPLIVTGEAAPCPGIGPIEIGPASFASTVNDVGPATPFVVRAEIAAANVA